MNKQVLFHIMGGLGNQFFQYACAYSIHRDTGADVSFYVQNYHGDKRKLELTRYNLPFFNVAENWALGNKLTYLLNKKFDIPCLKRVSGFHLQHKMDIVDTTLYGAKSDTFIGYWMNEDYFAKYINDIRKIYTPSEVVPFDVRRECEFILSKRAVCVHYRRGDYLESDNASIYASCTDKYYVSAMKYTDAKLDVPYYYIFSDDIEYAKEHWNGDPARTRFNDFNFDGVWDLYLMNNCSHHIVANSSFSWWGAYLSNVEKKQLVIAPEHYFQKGVSTYPRSWIVLDN